MARPHCLRIPLCIWIATWSNVQSWILSVYMGLSMGYSEAESEVWWLGRQMKWVAGCQVLKNMRCLHHYAQLMFRAGALLTTEWVIWSCKHFTQPEPLFFEQCQEALAAFPWRFFKLSTSSISTCKSFHGIVRSSQTTIFVKSRPARFTRIMFAFVCSHLLAVKSITTHHFSVFSLFFFHFSGQWTSHVIPYITSDMWNVKKCFSETFAGCIC